MYLEKINDPDDIRGYSPEQRRILAREMRDALITRTSLIGGHIGPNLGIIEATIALHTVFDSPHDKIVFDVSHQCYPHKMLTGRAGAYVRAAEYGVTLRAARRMSLWSSATVRCRAARRSRG